MVMDVDSRNLKSDPRPLGSPENPTGGHRTIRFRNFKVESEKWKNKLIYGQLENNGATFLHKIRIAN